MKVEQNISQLMGKTDKQIIEETWGCKIMTIKKSTKFNFVNGQF